MQKKTCTIIMNQGSFYIWVRIGILSGTANVVLEEKEITFECGEGIEVTPRVRRIILPGVFVLFFSPQVFSSTKQRRRNRIILCGQVKIALGRAQGIG